MKKIKSLTAAIALLLQLPLLAQVQVDHAIQLTGAGSNGKLLGIQAVDSNSDAANKIYVDTAIANRSGGSLLSHYIGEFYGGGMIVAIWDSSGVEQGLIVDTSGDLSSGAAWANSSYQNSEIGTSAQSAENGNTNTAAMIAQGGQQYNTAAYICTHYNGGGYNDWYLPALWELQQCMSAAMIANRLLGDTKGFHYNGNDYWTSTEWGSGGAFVVSFSVLYAYTSTKPAAYIVRAVRRY